jgi:hypothetical protein
MPECGATVTTTTLDRTRILSCRYRQMATNKEVVFAIVFKYTDHLGVDSHINSGPSVGRTLVTVDAGTIGAAGTPSHLQPWTGPSRFKPLQSASLLTSVLSSDWLPPLGDSNVSLDKESSHAWRVQRVAFDRCGWLSDHCVFGDGVSLEWQSAVVVTRRRLSAPLDGLLASIVRHRP